MFLKNKNLANKNFKLFCKFENSECEKSLLNLDYCINYIVCYVDEKFLKINFGDCNEFVRQGLIIQ